MPTDLKSCRLAAYLNYSLFNIHHSLFIVLGAVDGRVNDPPLRCGEIIWMYPDKNPVGSISHRTIILHSLTGELV